MDTVSLTNGFSAFLMGMITSPHCVGMCGPLTCLLLNKRNKDSEQTSQLWVQGSYHLSRLTAYILIAALAGALGNSLLGLFQVSTVKYFPWFLVVFLLIFALGLERYLPKPRFVGIVFRKVGEKVKKVPPRYSGVALGLATPFLPCAPLYVVFWAALFSGSSLFGAELALGFALGTIPLLWLAQTQFMRLQSWLSPKYFIRFQRTLAFMAALIVVWRIYSTSAPMVSHCCGGSGHI